MTPEQILKFIDAGYTKADIEKMETDQGAGGNDAGGNNAGGNDAGGNDAGGNNAGGNDAGGNDASGQGGTDTNNQTIAELLKSVQGLTETVKGLQEQNIKNAQQPPEDHKGFSDLVADFTKNM